MGDGIDEDRATLIAHEAINRRLEDFSTKMCKPESRRMGDLESAMKDLAKTTNGKINKLYYFLFIILGGIITNLLVSLLK